MNSPRVTGTLWRMKARRIEPPFECDFSPTTRRDFLQRAAGLAAGATGLSHLGHKPVSADPAAPLLPTIRVGSHAVTRLIIGGNPIYGVSHFNRHLSAHLTDWHTPDRVMELLKRCEACGINTWQNSYAERTLADLDRYRAEGGAMQWLSLGKPDWEQKPQRIEEAARRKPIGIVLHGSLCEKLHREKKFAKLTELLKRIRDTGVLAGLSAHNPELIATAEEKGWEVDLFMCCLYYITRPKEEFSKMLNGEVPLGEIYLPSDPPRMFATMRQTRKPCLAYKILAAGRRIENRSQVRECFETAFKNIKPADAVIVGMYQQFSDQVSENAAIVRELCSGKA
ncbi:MAG: twin-arginine translocation signal domain-containing protein [Verrucomicrobiota bacterium]